MSFPDVLVAINIPIASVDLHRQNIRSVGLFLPCVAATKSYQFYIDLFRYSLEI